MANRPCTRNHYVPEWYQRRFFPDGIREQKFCYLDLSPDTFVDGRGIKRKRKALLRWGADSCFKAIDLYTTKLGPWESTEIEERFFGRIDTLGHRAIDWIANFQHSDVDYEAFQSLLSYMSIQKLRTPKGLSHLSQVANLNDRNQVLFAMQAIQNMHCAIWTECVWTIADASQSKTKFIISDHPVTVYNRECFPKSKWCRGTTDPDIRLVGTHTLFPLSLNKILIFTNLSWVRNPYQAAIKQRPNPNLFRPAIFKFTSIQTERELSDVEVREINFIIKQRAFRYIAAAQEEWLFPEDNLDTHHWNKLGNGYLLMPDPRSVTFSRETIIGYSNKRADSFDEYGHKPWQAGFKDDKLADREWQTFLAFQGEFARLHGAKRRGRSFELGSLSDPEDDADYHQYHLGLERKFRPTGLRKRRRRN